ncbi:DUF3037 domain-containing protein [Bacillus sp. FJAT-42376]|uniref:DUF3037 domain-containing protein n=1 Tax=Bacillus sp. FJAT-42376 TaxID=2014076 RepID=UPI0013DE4282|nr:DUF3037 domain-containing protein [Bacillus sp. FJAT-42376]
MADRQECWYSIVRYCADKVSGEVINVGIILHTIEDKNSTKFQFLSETSLKLKAITNSQVELNIYKSFKDSIEHYLAKSVKNMFGQVGEIEIGSPYMDNFLFQLHDYYTNKQLFLTKPTYSYTGNPNMLFKSLFETYIGEKYLTNSHKHVSVKKYMKEVFEEKALLDKKVKHDFSISPIHDLDHIKINIDFGYKNGVWNYLQTIPNLNGPSKNTEWFAKTKFMFENLNKDTKIHLMYRESDISEQKEFFSTLDYLQKLDESRISRLNLDNRGKVLELCNIIERDAHNLSDLVS